jgi:hypothetical protein
MYVFCVGMYRSCSTWQYQVASHMVEQYRGGSRLGFIPGEAFAGQGGAAGLHWQVLKAHDAHPDFAAALAGGQALAVYAYRDLRDVVYSLAHINRCTFEDIVHPRGLLPVCLDNDAFWTAQPRVLCQRYEDIIADPAAAVAELAGHLGIDLPDGAADALAAEYSLRNNRRRTAELRRRLREQGVDLEGPADALLLDEHTLLLWNHIREGRAGTWRELVTPRHLACLAEACTDWLIEHGYEQEADWWVRALEDRGWTAAEVQGDLIGALGDLRQTLQELVDCCEEHAATLMALNRLEQLGPVALGLAERFHHLSLSYPNLSATAKSLIRRSLFPIRSRSA